MKDGNWHKLRFIEKKRDKNGKLTHVLCAIRSVSDAKKKEQMLISQVAEAKKDAALKARFLSNMSHDIRTPLNGIMGMLDQANHYPDNLEMQQKFRDKMMESSKYLLSLVNNILEMNKLEAEEYTDKEISFNLADVLYKQKRYEEALNILKQIARDDVAGMHAPDAYYNLGLILEYLKQNDTALAIFKQIIVRNPTDYESVYKAADLSVKLNELDKAKSYLSLIPPESTVYSKAQSLANSMNTDMQTIKTQEDKVAKTDVHQIDQSNGMYNNITSPTGVTTDKNGNLYVACFSDNMIYKITPDGKRILFVKDAKINGPIALANDNSGNIYVSNYNSNNVVKISPAGAISIQISNVQKPYGLHVADGMLFVSSQGSNSVLRYKL